MAHREDPYRKLRPMPATAEDELCHCSGAPPIMLQAHLSPNPLTCLDCSFEVPPERLSLSKDLVDRIASWQTFHDCFYHLWLDSGEFEAWARGQLEDPDSVVNQRGRAVVEELNALRPAYYWWFLDPGADGFVPLSDCPVCGQGLTRLERRLTCQQCRIVAVS